MPSPTDPTDVAALLANLWTQARPTVLERVEVLRRAGEAAADDGLDAPAREVARGEAHKLAGLLGSYGIAGGTELARDAERRLEGDAPVDGAALTSIAARLRALAETAVPDTTGD